MPKKRRHTIIQWYPGEGELSYAKHGDAVQKEFEENSDLILHNMPAEMMRRLTPEMTELGKKTYEEIVAILEEDDFEDLSYRWDKKCLCSCGCSPGYRIYSTTNAVVRVVHSQNGKVVSLQIRR